VILAAIFLALAQGRLDGDDATLIGSSPTAHWEVEPRELSVGEPFVATLVVRHDGKGRVALDPALLDADTSWLELAPPRVDAATNATESRWRFEFASLEPGERALPSFDLELAATDGSKTKVLFLPLEVRFAGALGANEDEPRPARDFRAVGEEASSAQWPLFASLAGLAVLAAWAYWRFARRPAAAAPPPSALDRLSGLESRDLEASESVRAIHYELTALLREHLDGAEGARRRSLTDEEWLALVSAGLPKQAASELGEILRASREVKYGGAQPTQWAVRDTLAKSKRVAEAAAKPAESAA
jgi:hypothetical protein